MEPVPVVLAALLAATQLSGQITTSQLIRQGRLDEALAVLRQAVKESPRSLDANNGLGVVLDLMGQYTEAQEYFANAIKSAAKPLDRALAQRAMAIAHGFAGECKGAEKYENEAFDFYLTTQDFYNAGEVADEMGRLCIDADDLSRADAWYEKGHLTGLQQPGIKQDRVDLWNFRWAHARARLAARRGKPAVAKKLVAEAKAILDKGRIPEQAEYVPYLEGYVDFYNGDFVAAQKNLALADNTDPFIACLLAQAWEKLGNPAAAMRFYRFAASTTAHSVPAAYARPFAKKKLDELSRAPEQ